MEMENVITKRILVKKRNALKKVFAFGSSMNIIKIPIVSVFLKLQLYVMMIFWLVMMYCKEDTNLKPGYQCLKGSGRKFGYVCNEDLCNAVNTSRFVVTS